MKLVSTHPLRDIALMQWRHRIEEGRSVETVKRNFVETGHIGYTTLADDWGWVVFCE